MAKILVAGLVNVETTLKVESFPIQYSPVLYPFHGVNSAVSGVGFNVAKALTRLGNTVEFLSLVGKDTSQKLVKQSLTDEGIRGKYVLDRLKHTPQSVVIYDSYGNRQVNTDLKDIQDSFYPQVLFEQAVHSCEIAVLTNINFSRPFLELARNAGKIIASDVHAISDIEDRYNRDYMAAANILFMSHENLPCSPEDWARWLIHRYGTEIVVIGLGSQGAILSVKRENYLGHIPSVITRPVVNTVGAGDALFSSFIHFYQQTGNPYAAIRKAMVYASYKIGAVSASDGFLSEPELDAWCERVAV
ncbi:MAG: carbohydrate kinase family protein [Chloroflexi bacterium]|nr:carbohydrate kinase family protein [Chloroflexota bacterium]MCC6892146.1 carbohydrate kinase family protein [Anaerolineae bacterium]